VFYRVENETAFLRVRAQPGAGKNEICGLYGEEALKIRIKAPAVEGAANKELIKFLAKSFGVPKSTVKFKSGESSRTKLLEMPLSEKLNAFIEEMVKKSENN